MVQESNFTRDFQISLLTNIVNSEELMKLASKTMTVDDLDIPVCKLIYESALKYTTQYNKLIPISTLLTDVELRVKNPTGSSVQLLPEEHEALAIVLERVATSDGLDPDYYKTKLLEYLKHVRVSLAINDAGRDISNPDNVMNKIIEIHQTVNQSTKKYSIYTDQLYAPIADKMDSRVCFGLTKLDAYTYGGLTLGGLGMVTACPGVGKTTSLINFAFGAQLGQGFRSLFLTLELKKHRIMHRYQGIAAGIPASWFKKSVDMWPDDIIERYDYILSPKYPLHNYFQSVDMSDATHNIDDVDRAIEQWLTDTEDIYGAGEVKKCKAVYLDWLDMLSTKGLMINGKKVEKNYELYAELMKSLGQISRRYNIALWTATQGTREADGIEKLGMKHTSLGFHKNDAIEIGLGVAVISGEDKVNTTDIDFTLHKGSKITLQECSRMLCYNITKNREGNTSAVTLYQSPSLRLFEEESEWTAFINQTKTQPVSQLLGDLNRDN